MPRENVRDALRLAQAGWKVIPLHTVVEGRCDCNRVPCPNKPGKHPRITNWETRGTDELQQIADWWGKSWPAANIGVVCGLSGLVVIDIDPRNGGDEALDALLAEHGTLPVGPKAITGSGGFHLYFAHPSGKGLRKSGETGYIGNRAGVRPGIDVRADGGQVVAPPSVYVTGVMYRWEEGRGPEVPVPAMPAWLLDLVRGRSRDTGDFKPSYELPAHLSIGQRRQEFLSWGGLMRDRGASEGVIFASLMALNAERTEQPLTEAEVAELASDIAKRYTPTSSFVYVGSKPESGKPPIVPYNAAELEHLEIREPAWAVPGMLPLGLALLVGRAKLGKSYMVLDMAAQVAEGGIVMDTVPVVEGSVLYIALEDNQSRMQRRMREVHPEEGWPERLEIIDLSHRMPRMDEGGIEFIDAWLGQHPDARLVIIDTLQRFRSRQPTRKNAYAADVDEMEPLQGLAMRHGVAILFVHHVNKGIHVDHMDRVSGSAGIAGTADTTWNLDRPRGVQGQQEARLIITGRDVEEQDYKLSFSDYRWHIHGDYQEQEASANAPAIQELLGYMKRRPWENVTVAEVQAAINCPSYDAARMVLNRAVAAGVIRKRGRGLFGLPEDEQFSPEAQREHNVKTNGNEHPVRFGSVEPEPNKPLVPDTQVQPNRTERTEQTEQTEHRNALPDWLQGKTCRGCGQAAWSLRVGNTYECDVCRPAVVPIRREMGAE